MKAHSYFSTIRTFTLAATALVACNLQLDAAGLYRDGVGAKSMSLGGSDVSWSDDALTSLGGNPAGLGFMKGSMLTLGSSGIYPQGSFKNRVDSDGYLIDKFTAGIEGAVGAKLPNLPVSIALGFIPEAGLNGDWRYTDVPGGADGATTYGYHLQQRSEIIVLRTAVGVGVQITRQLSLGASVGFVYNENKLQAPYIFQNQPNLPAGFKTLLDLQTSGWGADGNFGLQYRPVDNVMLGLVYKTETRIHTNGSANGNAYAQLANLGLAGAPPAYRYNAEVDNVFPQSVSLGAAWQINKQWMVTSQVDWFDWSVFDSLPVKLSNGSNAAVNGVVKSTALGDYIPLQWSDEFVYRLGVEYKPTENWAFRAGYVHGKSPVPDSTLTPLTAAITEDTLACGVGYTYGRYSIDAAFQYSLPKTRNVGTSFLQAGEYDGTSTKLSIETFTVTATVKF